MKSLILLYLIPYTLCLFSCSGGNSDSADKKNNNDSIHLSLPSFDSTFEKGKVIPTIRCAKDFSVNYALYLPENYSADKKFPIIYFFDSHGDGFFPLEKYKDLAEKYGYILAGSNNSKNGMPWEQNEPQIKIFTDDTKEKINIDAKRIYTCGFSGGSRVASSVAIVDGGIACVIGMGAGFPSLSEPIHNRFDYIGFAGNEDFNMNEMLALNSSMDNSPIRHRLEIFNGKHEWASAETAEDAFVWLELNAMKDGLVSKNDSLIKNFVTKNENKLKNFEQKKNVYEELLLCKKMTNFLDGLADVVGYKKKAEELNASDELKKIIVKKEHLAKEEAALQEAYRNNFVLKNLSWWTKEVYSLNSKAKNKTDEDRAVMNKRLLNYLSLVAYMQASSALQSNQLELTENFLKIYQMVDPENSEHQYLFADLYARKKENTNAISSLKNAMQLGFNDVARMESDPSLFVLRNDSEYKQLVEKIKSKL